MACSDSSAASRSARGAGAWPAAAWPAATWRADGASRRSCASVVSATAQPPPMAPTTFPAGIRAWSRNTWLNDACPFICRSGLASTPGWRIGRMK